MIATNSVIIEGVESSVILELVENVKTLEAKLDLIIESKTPAKTVYITKKDIAKIFGVSPRTVINWTEVELIQSYSMGGGVFYKEHEIMQAPIPVNKKSRR